jgi:hypothetical protein
MATKNYKYKAVQNVSRKETYTTPFLYNLKPGQYAIVPTAHANTLLSDYSEYLKEFGSAGWADDVMDEGKLSAGNGYTDPDYVPEEWEDDIQTSPIEVTATTGDYTSFGIAQEKQLDEATPYTGISTEPPEAVPTVVTSPAVSDPNPPLAVETPPVEKPAPTEIVITTPAPVPVAEPYVETHPYVETYPAPVVEPYVETHPAVEPYVETYPETHPYVESPLE